MSDILNNTGKKEIEEIKMPTQTTSVACWSTMTKCRS